MALPMWLMYSLRASWAPSFCWSVMNWSGSLHEGDEEQAAEEGAAHRVDAVGEGVAPAQDADAGVLLVAGQADVGVGRDDRLALVVRGLRSPGW